MTTKLKIHQRIGIGVLLFLLFALFPELRVVINVLTNLKRFHRPVSSSLSI